MDVQQKIAGFRAKLADRPESRVFAPLAELLHETGETAEALELLEAGIARHPDYLSAQVVRARLLLAVGRRKDAVAGLRAVLQHDGQNVVVLNLLVDQYLATGESLEAVDLLRKLVSLDPEQERWPRELKRLERTGQVSVPGRDGFATMTLVDIYLQQGYRRRALSALYAILARDPDQRDVQTRIAELEAETASGRSGNDGSAVPTSAADETEVVEAQASPTPGGQMPSDEARQQVERRAAERERFAQWLASFEAERKEGP